MTDVESNSVAGGETAHANSDLRRLAMAIDTPPEAATARVITGTVTAVSLTGTPPSITVKMQGDDVEVAGIAFIESYSPVVGDTVNMIKQGSEVWAIGQIVTTSAAPTDTGWIQPTLAANITTDPVDPVRYRVIVDHGTRKVQMRGGVSVASAANTLWTMPTEARPVVNMRPILIARDPNGANDTHLTPNANGTMVLSGSGTAGSSTGGSTSTGNASVSGTSDWVQDPPFSAGGQPTTNGPYNDDTGVDHVHQMNHRHGFNAGSHSHSIPAGGGSHTHSVPASTWVSFNGIEYFL